MNCDTCEALKNPAYPLLTTPHWQVILAHDQDYLGRSYVTLLKHKQSLSELSRDEWQDFEALVVRLETVYEKILGGGRPFNWACMMNNAFQSDTPAPHVHWHLRPRHKSPSTINGETFTDLAYSTHYDKSRNHLPKPETLEIIADRLRTNLAAYAL